jgi:hypothetical protein
MQGDSAQLRRGTGGRNSPGGHGKLKEIEAI